MDTPEAENSLPDRVGEQSAYFHITAEQSVAVGKAAKSFTRQALAKPFMVKTRWRTALGRSTLPRYYARITTAEGKDLGELLVSNGLARIYGTRTPLPDGSDSRTYLDKLEKLEQEAKRLRRGAWAKSKVR